MPTLTGRTPKNSYQELLKVSRKKLGLDSELCIVEDGLGVASPLAISQTNLAFNGMVWPTTPGTTGQVLVVGANAQLTWGAGTDPANTIPAQTGNSGKFLTTDGTTLKWMTPPSSGGSVAEPDSITYEYNTDDNVSVMTEVFSGNNKVTTYTYNDEELVIQIDITYLGATRTEVYTYNDTGMVTSMVATLS